MRYAVPDEGRANSMTGGDAASQAQALRDSAATLLQQASRSSDLALRDALTRKALVQIEQARRLLDGAAAVVDPPMAAKLH